MEGRIGPIESVGYNSGRVEPVRGYSAEERSKKIHEIKLELSEREEIRKYLALYPNPDHLSFKDLLDNAIKGNKQNVDNKGYILDVGHHY